MSALIDFIALHPELQEDIVEHRYNKLADDTWEWIFPAQSATEPYKLKFKSVFGHLEPRTEVFVKQVLMPNPKKMGSSECRLSDGRFSAARSSVMQSVRHLKRVVEWFNKNPDKGCLSSMTFDEIEEFFSDYLRMDISNKKNVYPGLRAEKSLREYLEFHMDISHRFLIDQSIIDGFSVNLSRTSILVELVQREATKVVEDFDYATWRAAKSYDGLPIPKQMSLLAGAIEFLRSDKTKLVIALTRFQHQGHTLSVHNLNKAGGILSIGQIIAGKNGYVGVDPRYSDKREALLNELTRQFGGSSWEDLPSWLVSFKFEEGSGQAGSVGEYVQHLRDITRAAVIVFLLLTGARRSELEYLKGCDIETDENGDTTFRSYIFKTNEGIGAIRSIAGLSAEVVDLLKELKEFVDPDFDEPLFKEVASKVNATKRVNRASEQAVSSKGGLLSFINRHVNPRLSTDLRIKEFLPHSCRHAWAEFALRRFHGSSVPELIRQHFRHSFGSYMTKRYMFGKLYEEEGRAIELELIKELIGEAAKGNEQLYGPVGQYIYGMLDSLEFVGEDEIIEIASNFDGHVEVNAYGFCVVRSETASQAKCFDKATQLPNKSEACFEKCGGCINRLTLPSQREEIMNLGISLKVSNDSYKAMRSPALIPLIEANEAKMKLCANALKEIDEGRVQHV